MAKELMRAPDSLSVWERNMETLRHRQPRLALMLDDYVERRGHVFEHYENETPAGRWFEGLAPSPFFQPGDFKFEWNKKSRENPLFFLYGIGAPPYLFKAIRELPRGALSMVVVEPNLGLLAYTLHLTHVYLALPEKASLTFVTAPDELPKSRLIPGQIESDEVLMDRFRKDMFDEAMMAGVNLYGLFTVQASASSIHEGESDAFKPELEEMSRALSEWTTIRLSMLGNSAQDTLVGMRQMALMVPWLIYGYTYGSLVERFNGRPFIVVSAGPSLDKNFEQLRDVGDKGVIMATDAVLMKMLKSGIRPHIVGALERGMPTYNLLFANCVDEFPEECSRILLVASAVCTPKIYGRWPGPKILLGKAELPVDQWFINNILKGELVLSGASVAHLLYMLAASLKASSIAFIGQDLAYSEEGVSHAGGIFSDDVRNEQSLSKNEKAAHIVPAALGGTIGTSPIWLMFLRIFENYILLANVPTWDCTEGGALKAGAKIAPFAEYLETQVVSLEPMEGTLAEVVLERGVVKDKAAKFGAIRANFKKAGEGLDAVEATIIEITEMINRASSPALEPDRRIKMAAKVGALLDSLHEKNPMFGFVTQSYVYVSSLELAKTRFLDSVELVERWRDFHMEIVDAHTSVLGFIRTWLSYAIISGEYYLDHDLPMLPDSPDEASGKFEEIADEFGDGHDQVELRMRMDALLASCDPIRLVWPGRHLWQCAMFLIKEGRSEEATYLMDSAADDFDEREMPTDEIVSFLKDYAKTLMMGDLVHFPDYHKAELMIKNAAGLVEMGGDPELRDMMNEALDGQVSMYLKFAQLGTDRNQNIAKWFSARAAGGEALASGDVMKAMRLIWRAVCEYGEHVPDWATTHMEWLASNMEKFFDASDEPYRSTIDDILNDMASRTDVITKYPARYSGPFVLALADRGMDVGIFSREEGSKFVKLASVDDVI
ncbi:MAG: DUF115 domain-containing protein [Synergistaceae bacterium]|jgi:hypothetical protein|nr:DUF115 domain-containing protein [Synergistaceae bacterium]